MRFQLAELLWNGTRAVPADRASAVEWYLRAAQAGSAPAMRRLAELWSSESLGAPDPAEAARWRREAERTEVRNRAKNSD
ncbi:MAG: SEL1-like repeat protein [Verrucomicrobiae bacterium]|nr:SEL1-like repeat protein [Verrucomicrobiae bacterium]